MEPRVVLGDVGKHAFVGLGFPERSYSFDMNSAIQDHFRKTTVAPLPLPKLDLGLKEGETISINIGIPKKNKKEESDDLSKFALPKPPGFSFPKPPEPGHPIVKPDPKGWTTF